MPVRIRADLETLPAYVPGRTIPGAIKLASNELAGGPLSNVTKAIADSANLVNRYPDSNANALANRLADKFDVPVHHIAIGCGSVSLCQQIVQATCTPDDAVLFPWRSFEAYPIITQVVGAQQIRVPLQADHSIDLTVMAKAITPNTRVVFLCTPNNPTGTALTRDAIITFIDSVPEETLVVIDEAYREFVTDPAVPDAIELATDYWEQGQDNIAVLRTFSKAYGLAGLRVGYAVAPSRIAEALRRVYVPFSVNSVAQAAAIAALDSEAQMKERCQTVITERDRVHGELLSAGYRIPASQANFVWLPLGEKTAAFNAHCLANKVIVRAFIGEGARVTIGLPEENDAFLQAAMSFNA